MQNHLVKTVQDIYSAFGSGNLPAILAHIEDDVDWGFNVGKSPVPWHAAIKGKKNLPAFFSALATEVTFEHFTPLQFIQSENTVVVHLDLKYSINNTGNDVRTEQIHLWKFSPAGKVKSLRHFEDTHGVISAYQRV